MSIWGKILGGAAGMALGGPLGALIGAVAGHFAVDQKNDGPKSDGDPSHRDDEDVTRQIGFTIGVIALGAKMAKADGVVTPDEIAAFRRVFRTAPDEEENVARLFNQAKRDVAGFESYAAQLARMLRDSPLVLEQVLDCLFVIATADGKVTADEMVFLRRVAEIFGIDTGEFARIREIHLGQDESDPFTILGVKHDTPLDEIRARHRQLVRENHPDMLMAQGLPQEAIDVATEKLARINAAWDQVRKLREA
jgi:DnaJ like chaperone protein